MKVLVAYKSSTGNTKKVAEAIYSEITGEKELKRIEDVQDIGIYDLSFLGFPTHQFGPDKKTKEFLEKQCTGGRKVALFVTHCAPEDAPESPGMDGKVQTGSRRCEPCRVLRLPRRVGQECGNDYEDRTKERDSVFCEES